MKRAVTLWVPVLALALCSGVGAQNIERVSMNSAGIEGNGASWLPSSGWLVNPDGRYVAFQSDADNLDPADGNGFTDVFVRDRDLNMTTRVSVDLGGGDANGPSTSPTISADGRFVAFRSAASDLIVGDGNWEWDIFVRDLQLGQTTRVSVSTDGGDPNNDSGGPSISADGRYVAFHSSAGNLISGDSNFRGDIFVRDLQLLQTVLASVAWDGTVTDENSWTSAISGDGRHVVFVSAATNLVADDGNGQNDVFVRDLDLGVTTRASVDQSGGDADERSRCPAISSNGQFVGFCSPATDLVAGDTNGVDDIFVRDLVAETTTRVNVTSEGLQTLGAGSWHPSISANGRFVAFQSDADNLTPEDSNAYPDVLIHDRVTGNTTLLSVGDGGIGTDEWSGNPSISADGKYVAFQSAATNLAEGDTNGALDVFLARQEIDPLPALYCFSFDSFCDGIEILEVLPDKTVVGIWNNFDCLGSDRPMLGGYSGKSVSPRLSWMAGDRNAMLDVYSYNLNVDDRTFDLFKHDTAFNLTQFWNDEPYTVTAGACAFGSEKEGLPATTGVGE
jgi:Tol biopolymer transport system component